jgi:hypothetical protein
MVYGVYRPFQQYFSYIVAVSFIGGENWSTGENHQTVASHNVFALLSGSGGSFRGDSFGHRYPRVRGGPLRGRSGRHRFLGRGQGRCHRPNCRKSLTNFII